MSAPPPDAARFPTRGRRRQPEWGEAGAEQEIFPAASRGFFAFVQGLAGSVRRFSPESRGFFQKCLGIPREGRGLAKSVPGFYSESQPFSPRMPGWAARLGRLAQ